MIRIILFSLTAILFCTVLLFSQNADTEKSPFHGSKDNHFRNSDLWEIQLTFDATAASGAAGNAGSEFDGMYFYTTRWASNLIHKYDQSGNLLEEFSIPGITGLRDLAFDGTYMYGGAASTIIYQMDFNTKTLIGTISSPVAVRFIAYDECNDAFWCGNWSNNPTLVSRSGTALASFSTGLSGQYGAAFDNVVAGGPYLWIFDQGSGAGTPQIISQWEIGTGMATGVTHDVMTDVGLGNPAGLAGGLFTTIDLVPGQFLLGGLLQGSPDMFFIYSFCCPPPPCGWPINPDPISGSTQIPIDLTQLSWTNDRDSLIISNEVYFGTDPENLMLVQSGTLATSWNISPTPLEYSTTYYWSITEICSLLTWSGPIWSFTTEQNPNLILATFYPQSADYWTGTTDGTTKTDVSEVRTVYPEMGWMVFDISSILPGSQIQSIEFRGYVNATNWPFWSMTPMGDIYPVSDDAAVISAQVLSGYDESVAYIYSNETSSFIPGWYNYILGNNAVPDLQAAVDSNKGWFAAGIVDRDFSPSYYINFDGWAEPNIPYLNIEYIPVPAELISFTADVINGNVELNWTTATETNNKGFEVQKSTNGGYRIIGFVQGNGTSVQQHAYRYRDANVANGSYSYRLRQVDFDGSTEYSKVVEVMVNIPVEFNLGQNYPNPFNPTTVIEYSITEDGYLTLRVYNVLGQEVAVIVDGIKKAGSYKTAFDASGLSSGIYYYRIESSAGAIVRKMIVLK